MDFVMENLVYNLTPMTKTMMMISDPLTPNALCWAVLKSDIDKLPSSWRLDKSRRRSSMAGRVEAVDKLGSESRTDHLAGEKDTGGGVSLG